jgi:hypothetical protein
MDGWVNKLGPLAASEKILLLTSFFMTKLYAREVLKNNTPADRAYNFEASSKCELQPPWLPPLSCFPHQLSAPLA